MRSAEAGEKRKNTASDDLLKRSLIRLFYAVKAKTIKKTNRFIYNKKRGGKTRSIKKYSLEKNTLRYSGITKIFIEINDSCKENRVDMLLKNFHFF